MFINNSMAKLVCLLFPFLVSELWPSPVSQPLISCLLTIRSSLITFVYPLYEVPTLLICTYYRRSSHIAYVSPKRNSEKSVKLFLFYFCKLQCCYCFVRGEISWHYQTFWTLKPHMGSKKAWVLVQLKKLEKVSVLVVGYFRGIAINQ